MVERVSGSGARYRVQNAGGITAMVVASEIDGMTVLLQQALIRAVVRIFAFAISSNTPNPLAPAK
jgi:hypothetical protein